MIAYHSQLWRPLFHQFSTKESYHLGRPYLNPCSQDIHFPLFLFFFVLPLYSLVTRDILLCRWTLPLRDYELLSILSFIYQGENVGFFIVLVRLYERYLAYGKPLSYLYLAYLNVSMLMHLYYFSKIEPNGCVPPLSIMYSWKFYFLCLQHDPGSKFTNVSTISDSCSSTLSSMLLNTCYLSCTDGVSSFSAVEASYPNYMPIW